MDKRYTDAYFMREAIIEAKKAAAADEVPVGAVLECGGEIIARAHNQSERLRDATCHAEMLALREGARVLGQWRLGECTLYVTLEPCAMCAGAAVASRLKRLVFGAYEARTGCCGSVYDLTEGAFLHDVITVPGILEEECAGLIKEYFQSKR